MADYVRKGGALEDTHGRKCICNGLVAAIGLAQSHGDGVEAPIVTSGDDLQGVAHLLGEGAGYSAADVLDFLAAAQPAP